MVVFAFWLAVATVGYAYVGYPVLIAVVGQLRNRRIRKQPITPRVSLIIAAYNEERGIGERLENALALDYPPELLEILVASDGSSDATDDIVASCASRGVRLLSLPRRGKIPALDEAVRRATGEILVFSDANTLCQPGALRALAGNFADPEVGGVAGRTGYWPITEGESSSHGEDLYWRYDTRLKELESRTGSIVSAHGGLYAIRRGLYRRPAETAVTDDFVISTGVVEQGYRLVFERDAVAYEAAVPQAAHEFRRKIRLMTRAWRSVALRRGLLDPRRFGFYSLVFFSHKVLRRSLPVLLVALFACSLAVASRGPVYVAAAVGQSLLYAMAALGWATRALPVGRSRVLYLPFYFCMANAAALLAFAAFVRGRRIDRWEPQRHAEAALERARG